MYKSHYFRLLFCLMILQTIIAQVLSRDMFPISNYPMYTYKLKNSIFIGTFCADNVSNHFTGLKAYIIWFGGIRSHFFDAYTNKNTEKMNLIKQLLNANKETNLFYKWKKIDLKEYKNQVLSSRRGKIDIDCN